MRRPAGQPRSSSGSRRGHRPAPATSGRKGERGPAAAEPRGLCPATAAGAVLHQFLQMARRSCHDPRVLQSQADVPETVETVAACLDKVFSSRYGASLLPSYGEFIQAGLLTNSNSIKQLACKAVVHLLDKAGDIAVAVDTFVQHNLYPLLINCLIEGDEEISAIVLDAIKRLAEIPTGTDIIFPPDGQGLQLNKVAAQSSSMARIRILSLIAKLFAASSCTATAIRDSNLLSLFEDEIKDRKDMLKTLSALEVLYELAEHPHSNMFLLKTSLLQHITDVINDPLADSIVRSRASLISGRLLSSADAFMTIEKSCIIVT